MSTPTDPYNSTSRRPFDDEDSILAPLKDDEDDAWDHAFAAADGGLAADAPEADETTDVDAAAQPAGPATNSPAGPATSAAGQDGAAAIQPSSSDPDRPTADFTTAPTAPTAPTAGQREHRGPTRTSVMGGAAISEFAAAQPATRNTVVAPSGPAPDAAPEGPAFLVAADENHEHWSNDPGDDLVVEDIPDEPKKRTGAHVGVFFLTLLLVPVAWYFISDAGARLAVVPDNPWLTGSLQPLPLLELAGGIVVVGLIWLAARASSLGAQVMGAIVFLTGAAALAVPRVAQDIIAQMDAAIGGYNAFTGNVVYHLTNDLASGRFAVFGALLLLTGLVAHGARRRGQTYATAVTRRHYLLKESDAS